MKPRRPENEETRRRAGEFRFPVFLFSRLRFFPLLILLLLTPALLSGDAPDDKGAWTSIGRESESNPPTGTAGVGGFFAEVEIRDDLLGVDEYMMRVQVYPVKPPPSGEFSAWPQTQIPTTAFEADIRTMIKLRGVSVPRIDLPDIRPMVETRRETMRFDQAMGFVWNLIDATDYLILQNPEVVSGTEQVMCDVFFELAGTRLSLAEVLVSAGHARYEPHDWGKRIVEKITRNE